MPTENDVLVEICAAIRDFNRQLAPDARLAESPDTILIGEGGQLDSLGLINLLVMLEDALGERFGGRVVLLDENIMTSDSGPLRSVGTLASHVASQLAS